MDRWTHLVGQDLPTPDMRGLQTVWDTPVITYLQTILQQSITNPIIKARYLAAFFIESGAWLALPSPSRGLHLSNECFRISAALRLGTAVCEPDSCCKCGAPVDQLRLHGLSCIRSAGRHILHSSINDVILRSLISAEVPSIREPSGCCRSDGKRPDGMTLILWKRDTFPLSNLPFSSKLAGGAATRRETGKRRKYSELMNNFIFIPVTIETSGTWGIEGLNFIKEIGQRISRVSKNSKSTSFLIQRISITLQRGNVASTLGHYLAGWSWRRYFIFKFQSKKTFFFVLGQSWRPQQRSKERDTSNNFTAKRSAEYI
ncbi:hypothetical protein C0J52_09914 [Blattella germanica]|nr:hypothetical protein C0J52_09914 [Blattella germanica]